jgi:hypothetical protein
MRFLYLFTAVLMGVSAWPATLVFQKAAPPENAARQTREYRAYGTLSRERYQKVARSQLQLLFRDKLPDSRPLGS